MDKSAIELSASSEDYLETILDLEKKNKVARVKDIADQLGVLSGSVTSALKSLAEKELIEYKPYSYIVLTRKGASIAKEITRRHKVIKDFLHCVLLLEPKRAEENACRMEHAMDKEAVDSLVRFIEYVYNCPRTGEDWIQSFVNYYAKDNHPHEKCEACLIDSIDRYRKNKV